MKAAAMTHGKFVLSGLLVLSLIGGSVTAVTLSRWHGTPTAAPAERYRVMQCSERQKELSRQIDVVVQFGVSTAYSVQIHDRLTAKPFDRQYRGWVDVQPRGAICATSTITGRSGHERVDMLVLASGKIRLDTPGPTEAGAPTAAPIYLRSRK